MKKSIIFLTLSLFPLLFGIENAQAYIGPGAGFAFISSFFILLISVLLAIMTILFWPLRLIFITLRKKKRAPGKNKAGRVIIVGLDGLDPDLTARYMEEGKLPNLSRISETGTFRKLQTTLPPISPVAWSTFTTGVDPSRHNIFDFLNRDLRTYLPELSSTKIIPGSRSLSIGKYLIPLSKPSVKLLRKGKPFWNLLGKYGIFSAIIRVPITYPPEKLNGVLLSGMCVPDLKGTQGTFTSYTSGNNSTAKQTGGVQIRVNREGDRIETHIPGPDNSLLKNNEEMRIPLDITINGNDEAVLGISKEKIKLKKDTYSPWVKLTFKAGPGIKIRGICRFYIKQIKPDFEMYMTPINIDPESPSLPISSPYSYSVYLAKMMGSYATLGLAEDTWALNERVIDEEIFLEQAYKHHEERENMFFNALDKTRKGLCVCVFDTTDRIQHMFMRFIAEDHPAHAIDVVREDYADTVEQLYIRMDEMIGRVMKTIDKDDVLMVISDHGFKQFKRGVNLNSWLYKNGYLALKDGK
ncbi:MAG: nucleotide pyrophosphatase, partial [Nitrospirae bacterium]|nr:nucleotide pyrophosphatase [Nitrospirota bacterium]